MKIDTQTPHFELMSLPIGVKLESQYMYTNLYYSPKQKKLYTVIHQAEVSGKADIDIYELNFPPIPVSSFKQPDVVAGNASQNNQSSIWLYIIAGILVITGTGVFYYRKKKAEINRIKTATEDNKQTEADLFQPESANGSLTNDISEIKIEMPIHTEATTFHNYDFSKG